VSAGADPGPWLLFLDDLGAGAALAELLRERGASVATVEAGSEYAFLGGDEEGGTASGEGAVDEEGGTLRYRLDPGRADDHRELVADLRRRGVAPRRIVHLWSLTGELDGGEDGKWTALQDRSFYSLLFLAQAVGAEEDDDERSLLVVSDRLHSVAGEPAPDPEKATLLGAVKVIPREYPAIHCRSLDLETPAATAIDRCAALLLAEATGGDGRVTAVRGGRRWLEDHSPLRLPEAAATGLRDGGCYLLTGGLGGVGLEVAEMLAREAKARLVLLGRSPLPPPEEWDGVLEGRGGGAAGRKIRRLRRLEELGAEVLTVAADVTDPESLEQAVAAARERFGRVDGVFHLAGIAGGGLIQLRTKEAARPVFAPKVEGARALEAALAGDPPELWVFFSSLSGVVGRLGQVDYSAANAFLDAYARDLARRTGARAVSVDWGEWLETGMAASETLTGGDGGDGGDHEDAEVETLDHPLLERRTVLPSGEEVFATDFDVHKHWVVDEHRLVGNPVIPGVAYVEMVRAAVGDRAEGKMIELHDLYFVAPLRVRDDETREVRLRLRPADDFDGFRFSVESDADEDEGAQGVTGVREYALGEVRLVEPTPTETLDLEAIKADCNERVAVFTDEEREDDLGPRWQNVQRAFVGRNQVLTHLALPEDFAPDFEVMKYHPSMMDRAAGVAKEYLYEGTYLPLTYKVLRIKGPIPRHIYTWARHYPEVDPSLETLTFDTRVMDKGGRVLVELDSFSQKLVTDAAVKIKSYAGHGDWGHSLTTAPSAAAAEERRRREMLPEEGIAALRRILAGPPVTQVAVSVRDLGAVIARADESAHDRILEETERHLAAGPARDAHPRPELATDYLAPRTDLERRLATVWEGMLGIAPIGVHDDFFELGGDSVQAIQIIAAIGKEGVELTPQQFFQHGTIAQLAELAGDAAGEEEDAGPLPLTAAQLRWLEAHAGDDAGEDGEPVADGRLFTLRDDVVRSDADPDLLDRAARHLAAVHPALRLRLERAGDGWSQRVEEAAELPVARHDLSATDGDERRRAVAEAAAATRAGLDPIAGPVARLAHLHLGEEEAGRILLALHPLAGDTASGAILLADLETLLGQLADGREPSLPPAATSLRRWAEAELQAAERAGDELDRWLRQLPAEPAPIRLGGEPVADSVAESIEVTGTGAELPADEARALLEEVERAYHAGAEETVLAAFARALGGGSEAPTVTVVRDPRTAGGPDLDRTVGPLELAFPVALPAGDDPGELLKAAKEALRRPAAGGAGYGRLRYLASGEAAERLAGRPEPRIGYRWSGERPAGEHSAPGAPELAAGQILALDAGTGGGDGGGNGAGGALTLRFAHRAGVPEAAVADLAAATVAALRELLEHCRALDAESFTPSDFPLADLDDGALDQLASLVGDADEETKGGRG
jgi:non-ribosomal peptide synthase protein (TIGR01720 family)